jgi:endonuclease-3
MLKPAAIREMFARLAEANPNPTTELHYGNTFQLLVAVILSAQATDKGVNRATEPLFRKIKTPRQLLALGLEDFTEAIRTIGLYRTKARNVMATAELLESRHGGEVPSTREELEALPGVGRKTANVVLNTAFGQSTLAVDTHVFRLANRTGLAPGKTVEEVEAVLMKRVPKDYLYNAHHWLILHGRYVCKAQRPDCGHCIIAHLCEYGRAHV